ncbi:DUF1523 family protein [Lachnospiraceae bacterium JLR.KK009]|nr:hypothetical protein C810_05192 [Lachnospiraceae bacterium A2]
MGKLSKINFVVVVIVVLLIAVLSEVIFSFNDTEYTVTITGKDRITESSKDSDGNSHTSSKYIVFADDENGNSLVFENTDCFIRLKFNSSNVQGQLKEGNTYKITVVGYRVPFFSWYQNIIKVDEVKQ